MPDNLDKFIPYVLRIKFVLMTESQKIKWGPTCSGQAQVYLLTYLDDREKGASVNLAQRISLKVQLVGPHKYYTQTYS